MKLTAKQGLDVLMIVIGMLMAVVSVITGEIAWLIVGGVVFCPLLAVVWMIIERRESK